MATQFPANLATFGLTNETGVLCDSISWNYSQDSKAIRSGTGDTVGKAYYDERIEVSFAGFLPVTTPYGTTLAATVALVTAPTDYLKGSVTSAIVESVNVTHANEEYRRIEVGAMIHPGIS
jgi:hypothetical protein